MFTIGGAQSATAATTADIASAGPLTHVYITSDLNCQVAHTGDAVFEFYSSSSTLGDCGTFAAIDGVLYGPALIDAWTSPNAQTPWTPFSQSAVTGAGTTASPYTVVTVVDAGATGVRLTETDTYVVGQEDYRTDISVTNNGTASTSIKLWRAGDCYLQGSDRGYGQTYASGAIACLAADPNDSTVKGTRVEQWFPLTAGSSYNESTYSAQWDLIGAQTAFTNVCSNCDNYVDNGAGLSWTFTLAAGASSTFSQLTSFSPAGVVPLTTSKTADSATATAGGADGYTITISNPGSTDVGLTQITDTLPVGFSYTSASTTGATTANPTVSGQGLTWDLTGVNVPHGGSVTLHFGVTIDCAEAAATYRNSAGGTAVGTSVAPVTDTAPVAVSGQDASCGGPSPDSTSLAADPSATQYSDPATLSATLMDTTTSTPLGSAPVTFTFNGTNYPATTNGSGVATATVPQVLLTPASYPYTVAYAGDSTHAAANGNNNVVVSKEDCTLSYTGDTTVPTGGVTHLAAQFGELDSTHGSWASKSVDFNLLDSTMASAGDPSTTTDATGLAATTASLPSGVYSVQARFSGDAFYQACNSSGTDLITVALPNAKVTGGGFILSQGHVNFGFNAASGLSGLAGQLQLRPGPHNRFHANTVSSLTVTGNTATWTGSGRWNNVAGYTFTATVVDNRNGGGHRGTADTFAIQIRDAGNAVVYTASGSLRGGNITVH